MKVDVETVLMELDGSPIMDRIPLSFEEAEKQGRSFSEVPLTFKVLAVGALKTVQESDRGMSETEIYRMYKIQQKIYDGGIVEMDVDDLKVIKDRVMNMSISSLIKGRMKDILDGKASEGKS